MIKKYRLTSNGLIHTPGMIAWLVCGYQTTRSSRQKKKYLDIAVSGYGLSKHVAKALLSGVIKYAVDDDMVVFEAKDKE
jgi:hypothetical protein